MTPFAIAGIQMHVSALHENVTAMGHRIDILMARFPWVQMVLVSELAAFGPLPRFAQDLPGPSEEVFQEMARRHGIWLIPGSLFEKTQDQKIYNTALVIDPEGNVVTRYRKMFPFRPYKHEVAAGTEFCVFDVPAVGRFGLSICYDIWFPETTRTLTSMGVEVLLHPVLTGTVFQRYIFDINGLGAGGVGRSCVIDPSATVLYQAAGQKEMIPIEIDLEQVRRQRETGLRGLGQVLKSYRDRDVKFDIYDPASTQDAFLRTLGPLAMPVRGSQAGLGARHDEGSDTPAPAAMASEPAGEKPVSGGRRTKERRLKLFK